ncbi:MAG TPA: ABC transporter ATP-binding protein [Ktedonobacteraceae bacterium]|nr:ABC transporter ATP-binding protein [Ktedonobacteraceae bacterium]
MTITRPTGISIKTTNRLLDIQNLSVDYLAANGAVHALNDVSISLNRGQVLGLAGESGSGKSTLAYAITRLLKPPAIITAGQVLYYPDPHREHDATLKRNPKRSKQQMSAERLDILELSAHELQAFRWSELSIVFQSAMNALNPVISIGEQIIDVLHAHRPDLRPSSLKQRAVELLRLVGIAPDRIKSYPHELSGGMRQRAMIAISLALSPELIIMDEPTTALDVVVQREILTEIMQLSKRLNFSVIFITHDLSLLLEIADKIAIMYAGRVVESASRQEIQQQPRHPYSYGLLNSFPTLHGERRAMTGIPGSPPDLRILPSGCAFHVRCPMAFDRCLDTLPLLQPSSSETPHQLVACHLYDSPDNHPTNVVLAIRYAENYERIQGKLEAPATSLIAAKTDSKQPLLEAEHLRKYFPIRQFRLFAPPAVVHAVEDSSLALYPGRALALVGESGSGKTTVARMLARLYEPTDGVIKFHSIPTGGSPGVPIKAYRKSVQLVFQDPFSSLNAIHNVRYHLSRPLRIYKHASSKMEETEQILALLNRVALSPAEQFIEKFPHQLSGGQRQRVAIARALAARPQVLLADEPVSMLDVSIRLDVLNLLLKLKREEQLALLFITHDIASARYFAEDTLVMYAGQSVEGGPSEEVIQRPKHPYTQLLIAAAPDPERVELEGKNQATIRARGEIPSLITPPTGCRFHTRCPAAMPVCKERFPGRTDLGGGHWTNCFLYGD